MVLLKVKRAGPAAARILRERLAWNCPFVMPERLVDRLLCSRVEDVEFFHV